MFSFMLSPFPCVVRDRLFYAGLLPVFIRMLLHRKPQTPAGLPTYSPIHS